MNYPLSRQRGIKSKVKELLFYLKRESWSTRRILMVFFYPWIPVERRKHLSRHHE